MPLLRTRKRPQETAFNYSGEGAAHYQRSTSEQSSPSPPGLFKHMKNTTQPSPKWSQTVTYKHPTLESSSQAVITQLPDQAAPALQQDAQVVWSRPCTAATCPAPVCGTEKHNGAAERRVATSALARMPIQFTWLQDGQSPGARSTKRWFFQDPCCGRIAEWACSTARFASFAISGSSAVALIGAISILESYSQDEASVQDREKGLASWVVALGWLRFS